MPGGRISEQMMVFARVWSMYVVFVRYVRACVLQLDAHAYAPKVVPMHGVAGDQWEEDAAAAVLGHRLGTIHLPRPVEGRRRACVRTGPQKEASHPPVGNRIGYSQVTLVHGTREEVCHYVFGAAVVVGVVG